MKCGERASRACGVRQAFRCEARLRCTVKFLRSGLIVAALFRETGQRGPVDRNCCPDPSEKGSFIGCVPTFNHSLTTVTQFIKGLQPILTRHASEMAQRVLRCVALL